MSFISGMLQNMARREEVVARNDALAQNLKTAKIRGETKCVQCGWCCSIRSCIPTPDELVEIARFLEKTPQEAIEEYFVIDTHDNDVYFVKPLGKKIKDLAGKYIPADRTFDEGSCIFLTEDIKCAIYEVRPRNARECECWSDMEYPDPSKDWAGKVLEERFGVTWSEYDDEDNGEDYDW